MCFETFHEGEKSISRTCQSRTLAEVKAVKRSHLSATEGKEKSWLDEKQTRMSEASPSSSSSITNGSTPSLLNKAFTSIEYLRTRNSSRLIRHAKFRNDILKPLWIARIEFDGDRLTSTRSSSIRQLDSRRPSSWQSPPFGIRRKTRMTT